MAIVCGVTESSLEKYYSPLGAPWLFGDNQSDNNPSVNGITTLVFALITFQNIVPISLYISIEFVRTAQAAFIYFDKNIWYEKTGQPTLARSWNLSDDLGQIEYIFSDKTGTLTQVRAISVIRKSSIDREILMRLERYGIQKVLNWRQGVPRKYSGRGNPEPRRRAGECGHGGEIRRRGGSAGNWVL